MQIIATAAKKSVKTGSKIGSKPARQSMAAGALEWDQQAVASAPQQARHGFNAARDVLSRLLRQTHDEVLRHELRDIERFLNSYQDMCKEISLITGLSQGRDAKGLHRALDGIAWMARQHAKGLSRDLDTLIKEPSRPGWTLERPEDREPPFCI